tara:strand:- start:171 stop:344 length:174 start_codon:yes stop_codon:yes gene_type:complete
MTRKEINKAAVAAHRAKKLSEGYYQLACYAPARDKERIKKYIDKLSKAWERERGGLK